MLQCILKLMSNKDALRNDQCELLRAEPIIIVADLQMYGEDDLLSETFSSNDAVRNYQCELLRVEPILIVVDFPKDLRDVLGNVFSGVVSTIL